MMQIGQRYRIKTPTIALTLDVALGHHVAITLPEGSVIEVIQPPTQGNRSMRVRWDGKDCEMFAEDLQGRGELVKSAGDRLPF